MQITPDNVISFGLYSGAGKQGTETTEVLYPNMSDTVNHGFQDPTRNMASMLPAFELGDDAQSLIATAVSKLDESGITQLEPWQPPAAGSGIPYLSNGEHALRVSTFDRTYQATFTDADPGPFQDALAAVRALRDTGLANGPASTGGAAGL